MRECISTVVFIGMFLRIDGAPVVAVPRLFLRFRQRFTEEERREKKKEHKKAYGTTTNIISILAQQVAVMGKHHRLAKRAVLVGGLHFKLTLQDAPRDGRSEIPPSLGIFGRNPSWGCSWFWCFYSTDDRSCSSLCNNNSLSF